MLSRLMAKFVKFFTNKFKWVSSVAKKEITVSFELTVDTATKAS
jgi:hypothetical protein